MAFEDTRVIHMGQYITTFGGFIYPNFVWIVHFLGFIHILSNIDSSCTFQNAGSIWQTFIICLYLKCFRVSILAELKVIYLFNVVLNVHKEVQVKVIYLFNVVLNVHKEIQVCCSLDEFGMLLRPYYHVESTIYFRVRQGLCGETIFVQPNSSTFWFSPVYKKFQYWTWVSKWWNPKLKWWKT